MSIILYLQRRGYVMKFYKSMLFILISILISILSADLAMAASREGGDNNDPTHKLKLMLRQVMTEKQSLTAKNVKYEAEIAKLKKDKQEEQKKLKNTTGKLKKSGERDKKLTENLQASFETIRNLRTENNAINSKLQVVTVHKKNAEEDLGQCMKMNVNLFDAGKEVLNRYEKEISSSVEPLFRLKSVDIETAVQDYRFKMEDLSIPEDKVQQTLKKIEATNESVSAVSTE